VLDHHRRGSFSLRRQLVEAIRLYYGTALAARENYSPACDALSFQRMALFDNHTVLGINQVKTDIVG
jgi:hypothetical protein